MTEGGLTHINAGEFSSGTTEHFLKITYSGASWYKGEASDLMPERYWDAPNSDKISINDNDILERPYQLNLQSREQSLLDELRSYLDLPEDWDGYGGATPTRSAILDAMRFLTLRPHGIPLPNCEVAADGEVGFYWKVGDVFAEVGFYGDGEYSFYGDCVSMSGKRREVAGDRCSLGVDQWDGKLLALLGEIRNQAK